jgi:hypothetical protein
MTEDTIAQLDPASAGTMDEKLRALGTESGADKLQQKELFKEFRKRIDACKQYRRKLVANWVSNIDYRRGKPFASQTDEDRVVVNLDWSLTKSKHAALFSQVPQIHINHHPQTQMQGPWLRAFEQRINDSLITAGIEAAMDEVMPDVINAAGIAGVVVSHEVITVEKEVPMQDLSMLPPDQQEQILKTKMLPDGTPLQMTKVTVPADRRYVISRISPADLLWPINFTGSDFDNAPWRGYSGRTSWAEAKRLFKLKDEDKDTILGGEGRNQLDKLTHDIEKDKDTQDNEVNFDVVFYNDYYFNPEAKSYSKIRTLVFVTGKDEPVIDEDWSGQRELPDGTLIGSMKNPVRILTLTYITDETIPPSDSAIGRPQVNEINKSRTQMILQRERSIPVRWFNVDRVDPAIQQNLMRGTWQGMIPVQGDGTRVIGEISRASTPQENFNFDNVAKQDLNEAWQIGPNQQGNFGSGRQSASEANLVESNFQTRIGRERAKVAKFFTSIAEVLGGLISLFEEPTSFGEGFDPAISRTLSYSILADSTVLLDSNQRLERLNKFIDMTAKSGWVDVGPVIKEIATLSGLDPNVVVKPPQPAPPVEPNISLRLTGVEDLINPLALAMLMKSGQAPEAKLIEDAKKLISMVVAPPPPIPAPVGSQGGPMGPEAPPPISGMPPGLAAPTGPPMPPEGPMPEALPPGIGEANADWTLMPKVNQRSNDGRPNS